MREAYQLPPDFILNVGRLDRKKNLSLLVEAFAVLRAMNQFQGKPGFVGQEYQKSRDTELYATVRRLGLQADVIFTGSARNQDLPAIMSAAQVIVSTSYYEGFGIAPLEAMACGTPLIVYRAGSVGEVAGQAGIVLEAATFEPLVHALILDDQNQHLRQAMRQRGLEEAKRFDVVSGAPDVSHYQKAMAT